MAPCFLALGIVLMGFGYICVDPVWHQRLFRRRYFCNRCLNIIAKEEALDEGRYEDRP